MLDSTTLLFAAALVVAFSGALLLLAQGFQNEAPTVRTWGASMLVGAIGLTATALARAHWAFPDAIGTGFLIAATALAWMGARLFAGRPRQLWFVCVPPALWLALIPLQAGSSAWLGWACLAGAGFTLASLFELWRARSERLASRNAAIVVLSIHVAVYAGRGVVALVCDLDARWTEPLMDALLIESMLHTMGMSFLILAMMKERVELRSSESLRALALQDSLTGIGNRRHFDEQLAIEVRRARRSGGPLALLLIDVDHFKRLNDSLGHVQGDACLREMARSISRCANRPGDLAARYGGEEFAVLLIDTDLPGAMEIGETIRRSVEALEVGPLRRGQMTVSIGAAVFSGHRAESTESFVHAADGALYRAKSSGRNQIAAAGTLISTTSMAA